MTDQVRQYLDALEYAASRGLRWARNERNVYMYSTWWNVTAPVDLTQPNPYTVAMIECVRLHREAVEILEREGNHE